MAFCGNCGKQLPEGAAFCTECGKPVAPVQQTGEPRTAGIVSGVSAGANAVPAEPVTAGQPSGAQVNIAPRTIGASSSEPRYGNTGKGYYSYDNTVNSGAAASGSAGRGNVHTVPGNTGSWYGEPRPVNMTGTVNRTQPARDEALIRRIRETGGSALHLVLIICMALSAAIGILSKGRYFLGVGTGSEDTSFLPAIIGSIPVLLATVGLLMFYLECRKETAPKGSGLGLYKASKIVLIVLFSLALLLAVVALLLGGSAFSQIDGLSGLTIKDLLEQAGIDASGIGEGIAAGTFAVILAVLGVVLVVLIVLGVLLEAKLLKGAYAVTGALETGTRTGNVPVYPLVIYIILAVVEVLSIIGSMGILTQSGADGSARGAAAFLPLVSSLITTVRIVLTAIMLSRIRTAVNE